MSVERLLLRADALWDGTGAPPLRPGRVLIEDQRIVAVGARLEVADARPLDLAGSTLLPGLIDMHGHCRTNARLGSSRLQFQDEPVSYVLHALANLRTDLAAGVTTVKTNGDRDLLDVGLREAIGAGLAAGPRLLVAGRGIKAPGCTAGLVATAFCVGPSQVRTAVERNFDQGADFVKLFVSGGLMEPPEEACRAYYTFEEIRAAVEAAERAGSYVVAHCVGGPTATWCAQAGVRVIEHGYYLTDEQIETLRQHGTWLDITLGVAFHPEGHGVELVRQGAEPAEIERREEAARDTVRRLIANGNRFLFGTDTMHGLLAYEAEQAVALGATPLAALGALTRQAAEAIDRADRLGTLEAGKLADLIAVRGDPTTALGALWEVEAVFKEGRRCSADPTPSERLPPAGPSGRGGAG